MSKTTNNEVIKARMAMFENDEIEPKNDELTAETQYEKLQEIVQEIEKELVYGKYKVAGTLADDYETIINRVYRTAEKTHIAFGDVRFLQQADKEDIKGTQTITLLTWGEIESGLREWLANYDQIVIDSIEKLKATKKWKKESEQIQAEMIEERKKALDKKKQRTEKHLVPLSETSQKFFGLTYVGQLNYTYQDFQRTLKQTKAIRSQGNLLDTEYGNYADPRDEMEIRAEQDAHEKNLQTILPDDKLRVVIEMRHERDYQVQQIATELNITVRTVNRQETKALERLIVGYDINLDEWSKGKDIKKRLKIK